MMRSFALFCLAFASLSFTPLLAETPAATEAPLTDDLDGQLIQPKVVSPECNALDYEVRESIYCSLPDWSDIEGGRRVQRYCLTVDGPFKLTYDFIGGDCYASSRPWPGGGL